MHLRQLFIYPAHSGHVSAGHLNRISVLSTRHHAYINARTSRHQRQRSDEMFKGFLPLIQRPFRLIHEYERVSILFFQYLLFRCVKVSFSIYIGIYENEIFKRVETRKPLNLIYYIRECIWYTYYICWFWVIPLHLQMHQISIKHKNGHWGFGRLPSIMSNWCATDKTNIHYIIRTSFNHPFSIFRLFWFLYWPRMHLKGGGQRQERPFIQMRR